MWRMLAGRNEKAWRQALVRYEDSKSIIQSIRTINSTIEMPLGFPYLSTLPYSPIQ